MIIISFCNVFKILTSHRGLVTKQEVRGRVSDGGFLAVLPEPVLCYENASYHQLQVTIKRIRR